MAVQMLYPFAPHLGEELWQALGEKDSITYAPLPKVNPKYLVDDTAVYIVQVNGKLRGRFELPKDRTEEELMDLVRKQPEMEKHLVGEIVKTIFVPNKLLNIVMK
jgi:leucyl-tRNA synthetase